HRAEGDGARRIGQRRRDIVLRGGSPDYRIDLAELAGEYDGPCADVGLQRDSLRLRPGHPLAGGDQHEKRGRDDAEHDQADQELDEREPAMIAHDQHSIRAVRTSVCVPRATRWVTVSETLATLPAMLTIHRSRIPFVVVGPPLAKAPAVQCVAVE